MALPDIDGVDVAGARVTFIDPAVLIPYKAFDGLEIVLWSLIDTEEVGAVWADVSGRAVDVVKFESSGTAVNIAGVAKGIVAEGLSIVVIEVVADIVSVADLGLKL